MLSTVKRNLWTIGNVLNSGNKTEPFVLMYHRILDSNYKETYSAQPGMYVTKDTIEMHIKYLKDHFRVLPLKSLLDDFYNGTDVTNCCALTFDDGWLDNYFYLLPLVKKYKIHCTVFIPTLFIESNLWFWTEELSLFVYNHVDQLQMLKDVLDRKNCKEVDRLKKNKKDFPLILTNLIKFLKTIPKGTRNTLISQICKINRIDNKCARQIMNWSEIKEMHETGFVEFYPHSHTHEILTYLDDNDIEWEIELSSDIIKRKLKNSATIFSYPSGYTNERIKAILRKNKFEYALTTKRGKLDINNDRYEICRVGIHNDISYSQNRFRYCIR